MPKERALKITSLCIFFSIACMFVFTLIRDNNGQIPLVLTKGQLRQGTYIAIHERDAWDLGSPLAIYFFQDENNEFRITDGGLEVILQGQLMHVGNGVFKIVENYGYVITTSSGIILNLDVFEPRILYKEFFFAS
ncbi:MAG: hypothetical protein FWF59_14400 [Turicibacter sp.]|nr:hypothetical protein [Turicibacter sp.]